MYEFVLMSVYINGLTKSYNYLNIMGGQNFILCINNHIHVKEKL